MSQSAIRSNCLNNLTPSFKCPKARSNSRPCNNKTKGREVKAKVKAAAAFPSNIPLMKNKKVLKILVTMSMKNKVKKTSHLYPS